MRGPHRREGEGKGEAPEEGKEFKLYTNTGLGIRDRSGCWAEDELNEDRGSYRSTGKGQLLGRGAGPRSLHQRRHWGHKQHSCQLETLETNVRGSGARSARLTWCPSGAGPHCST